MPDQFEDTSLHAVEKLSGMGPVGTGTFGATVWVVAVDLGTDWKNTSLHAVEKLSGMEPVGTGTLGATVWVISL
jgi:hypothetical protein